MDSNNEIFTTGEKIKKLVRQLPEHKPSEKSRREFIARLYKIPEERRKNDMDLAPARRFSSYAGAATALFMLVMTYSYLFSPLSPMVMNASGTVKIYRSADNTWIFAENRKIKLHKDDIVKTFQDGQADVVIPNLYHIRVKRDSEIMLSRTFSRAIKGDTGFALAKGKIFAHYNKYRATGKELGIETPDAAASALGTDFMIESAPLLGSTTVGVLDGAVRVASLSSLGVSGEALNAVTVKAGERTVVRRGSPPAKPTMLLENELLDMGELYSLGTRAQVALLISTGPTRTRELLSATPLYISSKRSSILAEKFEPAANEINKAIRERSQERHIESIKKLEEIVNRYPDPAYDVQFLLFIGAYYKYLGEYEKAISTFRQAIDNHPNSSLTSIAECAIGIIYEDILKDSAKAIAAYQRVIAKYPQSPEAEEAVMGLSRLNP